MGVEASHQAGDYQEPDLPEGVLELRVSVYKLELTGVGFLDQIGAGLVGTYHTGLVVAGQEWAFGGHDMAGKSGVYCTKPELNEDYLFYQRVIMGTMTTTKTEVTRQIRQLACTPQWSGPSYDLIEHNCNHFVSELCWELMKKRPPDWINNTAEGIALSRRRGRAESEALAAALAEYRAAHGVGGATSAPAPAAPPPLNDAPGIKAFEDAFGATFELCWGRGRDRIKAASERCPEGEDPQALQRRAEVDLLTAAASAGRCAAKAVAAAARVAAEARAEQAPGVGLAAWDLTWARESSALLRSWREEAAAGRLDPEPEGEQGYERARKLHEALAAAAQAALAAAEAEERRQAQRRGATAPPQAAAGATPAPTVTASAVATEATATASTEAAADADADAEAEAEAEAELPVASERPPCLPAATVAEDDGLTDEIETVTM